MIFQICAILALLGASEATSAPNCNNIKGNGMIPDPDDCASFYWCIGNKPIRYTCPQGEVWNNNKTICVPEGSLDDFCSKGKKNVIDVNPVTCTNGVAKKLPHSGKCSKYYECLNTTIGTAEVKECPYPKLFDDVSKKCDYPERVRCGDREEPIDQCDYDVNACRSVHCVPCNQRYPSCKGKPDGLATWAGREWTPFYVVCKNERVLFTTQCVQIRKETAQFLFDPDQLKCVQQILISI